MNDEQIKEIARRWNLEPTDHAWDEVMGFAYDLLAEKREWVGLIKDEVDSWELPDSPTVFEFAQFVEAKLKEKNA